MPNRKFVERGWMSYRKLLPPNAGEAQVRETRQAFFAGAAILFEAIMRTFDPGEEPTDADMQRMSDIQDELREFGEQLDRRFFESLGARNGPQ